MFKLTKAQQIQFDRMEDNNLHSECVVLQAQATSNIFCLNVAEQLLNEHKRIGHMPSELMAVRTALLEYMKISDKQNIVRVEELPF